MDKLQLKHEKKELKMAQQAQKHIAGVRKILDKLEAMHVKLPGVVNGKSKKK